jgi:hypothetical protein
MHSVMIIWWVLLFHIAQCKDMGRTSCLTLSVYIYLRCCTPQLATFLSPFCILFLFAVGDMRSRQPCKTKVAICCFYTFGKNFDTCCSLFMHPKRLRPTLQKLSQKTRCMQTSGNPAGSVWQRPQSEGVSNNFSLKRHKTSFYPDMARNFWRIALVTLNWVLHVQLDNWSNIGCDNIIWKSGLELKCLNAWIL